jgi:hypothetical protein
MGTERYQEKLTQCLCGSGTVDEEFWADDHPFGNYNWNSSGIRLNCETCRANWLVQERVANPVSAPSGQRVIYFVRREEQCSIAVHNDGVEKQISALRKEAWELQELTNNKLRDLRAELLAKLGQDTRFEARFAFIGPILGIGSKDGFRTKVGKTRPATYISKLVTARNMTELFQRMNRATDVEWMRRTNERLAEIERHAKELESTKKLPMSDGHKFTSA